MQRFCHRHIRQTWKQRSCRALISRGAFGAHNLHGKTGEVIACLHLTHFSLWDGCVLRFWLFFTSRKLEKNSKSKKKLPNTNHFFYAPKKNTRFLFGLKETSALRVLMMDLKNPSPIFSLLTCLSTNSTTGCKGWPRDLLGGTVRPRLVFTALEIAHIELKRKEKKIQCLAEVARQSLAEVV